MATLELEARLDNLLSTGQRDTANIDLFAPIQEREECPICLFPLSLDDSETVFIPCCGKCICNGCTYQNARTLLVKRLNPLDIKCAFCRQQVPNNYNKAVKKLMKKNHPNAFIRMAIRYSLGNGVFQSDTRALEMYVCAAELGHTEALKTIGLSYEQGVVVVENMSKAVDYYEIAAKKGSVHAHKNLAEFHRRNENVQESIRHYKVAASAGDQESKDKLVECYKDKLLSKEDLTQTLRAYQTSNDLMKCKDRDDARAFNRDDARAWN